MRLGDSNVLSFNDWDFGSDFCWNGSPRAAIIFWGRLIVGLTYFKRFRMECDLRDSLPEPRTVPAGYELVPFRSDLLREHATAKFDSFRQELDTNVFPCLGRRDGCLRLMREIASRSAFVPEATWLLRHRDESGRFQPVGTVQDCSWMAGERFKTWASKRLIAVAA